MRYTLDRQGKGFSLLFVPHQIGNRYIDASLGSGIDVRIFWWAGFAHQKILTNLGLYEFDYESD